MWSSGRLERQIEIANENIKIQERSYNMAEVLYRNGEDSELDVQQALTLLLSTKSTLPALQIQLIQARNALSTLLAEPSGKLVNTLGHGEIPEVPQQIAIGIPADLLRRRADVRQTELLAVAQNALVGGGRGRSLSEYFAWWHTPDWPVFPLRWAGEGRPISFPPTALRGRREPLSAGPSSTTGGFATTSGSRMRACNRALIAYQQAVLAASEEVDSAVAGTLRQPAAERSACSNRGGGTAPQMSFPCCATVKVFRVINVSLMRNRHCLLSSHAMSILTAPRPGPWLLYIRHWAGGWEIREGRPLVDEDTLSVMRERTNWGPLLDSANGATQR